MEKIYNKLVRDKIPEIIKADNAVPKIKILNQEEFLSELFNKLQEEAEECKKTQGDKDEIIKEIGDIYEVVDAIIREFALDPNQIREVKAERRDKRGGFEKRIFLESVDEQ